MGRCAGPGLVCRALEIDRGLNGRALVPPHLYVADDGHRVETVLAGPRVGVAYAGEWALKPWRFRVITPAPPGRAVVGRARAAG